jgi:DNA adenine methylase
MRTGFNGIYQLNQNTNGRYGTPCGLLNQKDGVYEPDVLKWWNESLQGVRITSQSWEKCDDLKCFMFYDPPYRNCFADYGTTFTDEDTMRLISVANECESSFICNRADDDWFEDKCLGMSIHYFDITYTAGRRKKTSDGYEAKKAREILLYKSNRISLFDIQHNCTGEC